MPKSRHTTRLSEPASMHFRFNWFEENNFWITTNQTCENHNADDIETDGSETLRGMYYLPSVRQNYQYPLHVL